MGRDERLAEILGDWYARDAEGHAVDPEALTREHPDLAAEIRDHFRIVQAFRPRRDVRADVPAALGEYRLEREIGAGGMGTVFAAAPSEHARVLVGCDIVAVKVIHPHLLGTPGFFKRFLREAQIGRRVVHPNVVRTLDCDAVDDDGQSYHFLVMEYVEGQTLRDLLEELDRVPEELCRHVGHEIAKGLGAIHNVGAVHRDLKPENVLITPDHEVKVMDLGVARLVDESVRLSRTGAFVGSIHYAAPEQFARGGVSTDARTDLHALGLLLYELATGVHPFAGDDARAVMRKILQEKPRRIGDVNPQLTPFFEELVHWLLEKDQGARPQRADVVAEILLEGESSAWWQAHAQRVRAMTLRPLRRARIPREAAVYGREPELDQMRAAYERAASGDGQVLLVKGEAGIGKSRLVDELIARLRAAGEDVSYVFGSYPPGGAATATGGIAAAFRDHLGVDAELENRLREMMPHASDAVPAFAALLRGTAPPRGASPLTGDALQWSFVQVACALGRERTTVVLIDDLHFAPDDGRAMFSALAAAIGSSRVLLVGTTRPGVPGAWVASVTRADNASMIPLHRLGPKDLVNLLQEAFRSDRLAIDLGAKIGLKSDGNPFFVFEIIRGLKEGQFISQRPDGSWATTGLLDDIQVPSSVLDLVNARVAELDEDDRDLLDVAACCGFEFDPTLVGEALGMARVPVLKQLGQIERRHRLVRSAGMRYVFDHHQVQEALHRSIGEPLRREYHRLLGETLERRSAAAEADARRLDGALLVELSNHFTSAALPEPAVRYGMPALEHLKIAAQSGLQASLASRILATAGDVELPRAQRIALLRHQAWGLTELGHGAEGMEVLETALRLAEGWEDELLVAQVHADIGSNHVSRGAYGEARTPLESALEAGRRHGDRDLEMRASGDLGTALYRTGADTERSRRLIQRATDLARELGDLRCEIASVQHMAIWTARQGRRREAIERFERFIERAETAGLGSSVMYGMMNVGNQWRQLGDLPRAEEYGRRALRRAIELGHRRGEEAVLYNLASVLLEGGRFDESVRLYEGAVELARSMDDPHAVAFDESGLAWAYYCMGDYGRALACVRRGLTANERLAEPLQPSFLHTLACVHCAVGAPDTALDVLERERERRPDVFEGQSGAHTVVALAWTHVCRGDLERAAEHLSLGTPLVRALGDRQYLVRSLCLHASTLCALGRRGEAREALAEARDQARGAHSEELPTLVTIHAAVVDGTGIGAAIDAYDAHGRLLSFEKRMSAALDLWRVSRDERLRRHANELLDQAIASAPADCARPMVENVALHRAIREARGS